MKYVFYAQGHPNITSKHRTTFEITKDPEVSKTGDCIVGVKSTKALKDLPENIKKAIANENSKIKVILETENAKDEIIGYGHPNLTLKHPTDIVCRKSNYICDRTLMIKANKAAKDLNPKLIKDLKNGKKLKIKLVVKCRGRDSNPRRD